MKPIVISVFLLFLMALLSCSNSNSYEGDGVLTDKGITSATNRYVLELGKIQLNRKAEYSFFMSNLPQVEMVVGFSMPVNPSTIQNLKNEQSLSTIRIRLTNGKGKIVIQEEGPLRNWVWSETPDHCFVYRRGLEKEIRIGEKSSYPKRTGVKTDSGWGTYFTPQKKESYKLSVAVFPTGNADTVRPVLVQVIGGGWK